MSEQPKSSEGQDFHIEGAEERAKRFYVGATKNPDGTMDLSKAMYAVGETHDKFEKSFAEADEKRAQETQRDAEWRQTIISQYDEKITQTEGTPDAVGTRYERTIYMIGSNKETQPRDKETAKRLTLQRDIYELTSRYAENGYDPVDGMGTEPEGTEAKAAARRSFELRNKILDGLESKLSKDFVDGKEYTTVGPIHAKTAELIEAVSAISLKLQEEVDKAKQPVTNTRQGHSIPHAESMPQTEQETPIENPYARQERVEDRKPYEIGDVLLELRYQIKEAERKKQEYLAHNDKEYGKRQADALDKSIEELNQATEILSEENSGDSLKDIKDRLEEESYEISQSMDASEPEEEWNAKDLRIKKIRATLKWVGSRVLNFKDQMPHNIQEWYLSGQK